METKRCNIRKAELLDSEFLMSLFSIPDVIKHLDGVNHFISNISCVKRLITNLNFDEISQGKIWVIEIDSHKIGFIMVYDLSENPFISYALLPQYRGYGYIFESVMVIGESIFNKFRCKVSINADRDNLTAIKLKDKILNSPLGKKFFK